MERFDFKNGSKVKRSRKKYAVDTIKIKVAFIEVILFSVIFDLKHPVQIVDLDPSIFKNITT